MSTLRIKNGNPVGDSIIPTHGKGREEHQKFKAIGSYIASCQPLGSADLVHTIQAKCGPSQGRYKAVGTEDYGMRSEVHRRDSVMEVTKKHIMCIPGLALHCGK